MELTVSHKRQLRRFVLETLMNQDQIDYHLVAKLLDELAVDIEKQYEISKQHFEALKVIGKNALPRNMQWFLTAMRVSQSNNKLQQLIEKGHGQFKNEVYSPLMNYMEAKIAWPCLHLPKYEYLRTLSMSKYQRAKLSLTNETYRKLIKNAATLEELIEVWPNAEHVPLSSRRHPPKPMSEKELALIRNTNLG